MAEPCTGLTARWCPVHGDCICAKATDGLGGDLAHPRCPLHGTDSQHPLPELTARDRLPHPSPYGCQHCRNRATLTLTTIDGAQVFACRPCASRYRDHAMKGPTS